MPIIIDRSDLPDGHDEPRNRKVSIRNQLDNPTHWVDVAGTAHLIEAMDERYVLSVIAYLERRAHHWQWLDELSSVFRDDDVEGWSLPSTSTPKQWLSTKPTYRALDARCPVLGPPKPSYAWDPTGAERDRILGGEYAETWASMLPDPSAWPELEEAWDEYEARDQADYERWLDYWKNLSPDERDRERQMMADHVAAERQEELERHDGRDIFDDEPSWYNLPKDGH
jgi:hypothetical protein